MARLCVFGGTFDPIHNGHLIIARLALERFAVDRMLFVPAGTPPHKKTDGAGAADRLAMTRLATAGSSGFETWDEEVRRGGESYAIDTVRALRAANPADEICWLIGADSLAELPRWRSAEELLAECRFLTYPRAGFPRDRLDDLRASFPQGRWEQLRADFLDAPLVEISSTHVRARLRAGLSVTGFIPDAVRAEIERRGWYRRER
ncbi:MAG: nicotinate (nicotinamide) nucleotide adenylyltransferase [Planctomycetes bacterium]|nr:nicotinate (nicotinamide) nucleotide adenylyltransferase [Planctomycetota bacterium]